jgi:hypothetical protein
MPIIDTDIKYRLSGGASNADPAASIGGAKSTTEVAEGTLFDTVTAAEALAGDVEYRCVYVHNAHATLTMISPRLFLAANTSSTQTSAAVGIGAAALNATEPPVANENTAPAGVTFSAPGNYAAGIALPDVPPGQHQAIWLRRTVDAAAGAQNDDFAFEVRCETMP